MTVPNATTPDLTSYRPPRHRRWIPLSLQMFVAHLLILGVVGVLVIGVPAYPQFVATREIDGLDGAWAGIPRGPTWLTDCVPVEWIWLSHNVCFVDLSESRANDATLNQLKGLTGLEELQLDHTAVTDAGLAQFKGHTHLKALSLRGTRVGDSGLAHLEDLNSLEVLILNDTRVTDAGLAHLAGLAGLEHLSLENTQVTAAGIARLKQALPRLTIYR